MMKMFYFSHVESGWDFVAHALNLSNARGFLALAIEREVSKEDAAELLEWAKTASPIGHFHYPACLAIFTECDPRESRASRQEWDRTTAALQFYAKREHWMARAGHDAESPSRYFTAQGKNFREGHGWEEAEAALPAYLKTRSTSGPLPATEDRKSPQTSGPLSGDEEKRIRQEIQQVSREETGGADGSRTHE